MASSGDNNNSMGFHSRDESAVNCQSSGMSTGPFFPATWDPVVSLSQNESFRGSSILSLSEFNGSPYTVALGNQGIPSNSHLVHYQSDSSFGEMVPKFPCFGSGSFSEMVDSLGLTDCSQISNIRCPPNYTSNRQSNNERNMQISAQTQEDHRYSAEPGMGALPYGKRRKRGAESSSPHPDKDAEGAVQKDSSAEISDVPNEQDEKKSKSEQNISGANPKSKQTAKQTKENACSGEAPKDNYIHVRARRGQATNSHSLAERVRREKISERMRMLQELVPGCNKITGKAVMLDEIINYVQSLQQQVEFLSMKLATVNPELNIGLERILSKDVLHARNGNGAILGLNPGISSQPYSHGILQVGMPIISNTNHQILSSAHTLMDNDFQTLLQMGYNSSSAMDNLGVNGHLKPEP